MNCKLIDKLRTFGVMPGLILPISMTSKVCIFYVKTFQLLTIFHHILMEIAFNRTIFDL